MVNSNVVARCSSSTHHRAPAYGRTCSDQPIGENQDTTDDAAAPALPTARTQPTPPNAPPNTPNPPPRAKPAPVESCAATAATALTTRPEQASAVPNASDPEAGTLVPSRPAAPTQPVSSEAPNESSRAAVRPA